MLWEHHKLFVPVYSLIMLGMKVPVLKLRLLFRSKYVLFLIEGKSNFYNGTEEIMVNYRDVMTVSGN